MEPSPEVKTDEVVLVVPRTPKGYTIFTLQEPTEPSASFSSLPYYHLSKAHVPDGLSQGLTKHLISPSRLPAHLGDGVDLHVVVSTRSGTGRAQVFYDSILVPLLSALGLHKEEEGLENNDGGGSSSKSGNSGSRTKGYHLVVTSNSGSVHEFARSTLSNAQGGKPTSVILLSGDGGVVDLLNSGPGSPSGSLPSSASNTPVIALLPLGTGNALFHSIHRPLYDGVTSEANNSSGPTPLVLALRTLFTGTSHKLPAFKASFSPGARLIEAPSADENTTEVDQDSSSSPRSASASAADHRQQETVTTAIPFSSLLGTIVCSYGFHASLVYESDTPAMRKFGNKRFGMAAAELLKTGHAYDAAVDYFCCDNSSSNPPPPGSIHSNDGESWTPLPRASHAYVLAAHVSNMERTFRISPSSTPLDGTLWLVHFAPLPGEEVMKIMHATYDGGSHVGMEEVGYLKVDGLRVRVREEEKRWRAVCVDGTIVQLERGGWLEVRRGAESGLRVLVPGDGKRGG